MDELTGYEEHMRDEATECGERRAMREAAYREHEMEAQIAEEEDREREAEWLEQQADPLRSVCLWIGTYERGCESYDPCPF